MPLGVMHIRQMSNLSLLKLQVLVQCKTCTPCQFLPNLSNSDEILPSAAQFILDNLLLRRPKRLIFCWSSHVTSVSTPSPCCHIHKYSEIGSLYPEQKIASYSNGLNNHRAPKTETPGASQLRNTRTLKSTSKTIRASKLKTNDCTCCIVFAQPELRLAAATRNPSQTVLQFLIGKESFPGRRQQTLIPNRVPRQLHRSSPPRWERQRFQRGP